MIGSANSRLKADHLVETLLDRADRFAQRANPRQDALSTVTFSNAPAQSETAFDRVIRGGVHCSLSASSVGW